MLDNSQGSISSQKAFHSERDIHPSYKYHNNNHLEEESQLTCDKEWLSDQVSVSCQDQLTEINNRGFSNQKKSLFNKKNSHMDFNDTDSVSMASMEFQIEGYEMSELLQRFDNISKNNISKNIIKAFFGYLLDTGSNDLLTDFVSKGVNATQSRKMAKNYFKTYSFNNNSLHKLIQHPKYGKAFEFYLTFEAENWLAESKVQEKNTHLIYIDFLKLCCSNPIFSDHIVTYKKNKRSKFNDRI